MNTTKTQFSLDIDGTYRSIDNMSQPLVSTNNLRHSTGAHLLRGR
jgi:hypothetical protein